MKKLIVLVLFVLFIFGCVTPQTALDVPEKAKNRVFLTNFLKCHRMYVLVDEYGREISAGTLAGYGHKGDTEKETLFTQPPWTVELLLSAGKYTLTVWCPVHDIETMTTFDFEITLEELFPPEGEGPLTLEIVGDKE